MPTSIYGGQGAPSYNRGIFTVKYTARTAEGGRQEIEKEFTDYDQAETFYSSIDDSAAIWDNTSVPELCEAKTRIAYYTAILQSRKSKATTKLVHVVTDEQERATMMFARNLRGSGWQLQPDSVQEITRADYKQLDPANDIELLVPCE
jgi:hypothetical protein